MKNAPGAVDSSPPCYALNLFKPFQRNVIYADRIYMNNYVSMSVRVRVCVCTWYLSNFISL